MRKLRLALGIAGVLAAFMGSAQAEEPAAPGSAKDHFQKGTKYFDLGHFDDAVKEYEAAYEIKDEPVLLYNIAQAHRLANHFKEAVHFYKAYKRRMPNAPNRDEVNAKIDEIEKLIEQQKRTSTMPPDNPMMPGDRQPNTPPRPADGQTTPPPVNPTTPPPDGTQPAVTPTAQPPVSDIPTPQPEEKKPVDPNAGKTKKIAGLALVGVGAVAIIGGIVCSALAVGAGNDVTSAAKNGGTFDPSKESSGHTDQLVAGVMYGVGGAALVAGAVVTYLGFRDAKNASQAMLVPAISPSYAGASFKLSF